MNNQLKTIDEIILRHSKSLQQMEPKTFSEILVEYFMQYWKLHRMPDDGSISFESLPMFHGMFISARKDLLAHGEKYIRKVMPFQFNRGLRAPLIYNRAGEFTFLDLTKEDSLQKVLNGRTYDIYILMEDIEPTEEMITILAKHTKDGLRGRIFSMRDIAGGKLLTA